MTPCSNSRLVSRTAVAALFAVTALTTLIATAGCRAKAPATVEVPTLSLETSVLAPTEVSRIVEADGSVIGIEESSVSSRLAATVVSVHVKAGETVAKGSVLVRLDPRETQGAADGARASLASATIAVEVSRKNRERFEALSKKGAAAAIELDRARLEERAAEAQAAAAQAALRRAETDSGQAVLTAPFDAVVVDRLVSPGDLAVPGRPLVRLATRRGRRAEVSVAESDLPSLKVGDSARAVVAGETLDVRVVEVVAALDPGTRRRTVRLDLPGGANPAPGTFARALFEAGREARLLVPASAVLSRGGMDVAFVVGKGDLVELRYVQTGSRASTGLVEIRAGLAAGDRLVLSPPETLEAGTKALAKKSGAAS